MAITKEEILDAISEMSVMDVVDLVKLMEEKNSLLITPEKNRKR